MIRLLVGVMDRTKLPLSTDIVFHNVGYDITFMPEEASFVPAHVPHGQIDHHGRYDGEGSRDNPEKDQESDANKRQKNKAGSTPSMPPGGDKQGSAPMQVDSAPIQGMIAHTSPGKKPVVRSSKPGFFDAEKPVNLGSKPNNV